MNIKQTFGAEIKRVRKIKKITQQVLCAGICSQPMLSAVEEGKYMPNGEILVKLCQRLEIDTDLLLLHDHYAISQNSDINQVCENLCNNHQYADLKSYLLRDDVINAIELSEQTQAYYYYLACSQFQSDQRLDECKSNFQIALAEADGQRKQLTLTRLTFASLGVVFAKQGLTQQSVMYLEQATKNLEDIRYEKNQNILYYLAGYAQFLNGSFLEAAMVLEKGIRFINQHDTHYMLANIFYLLARVAEESGQSSTTADSKEKSEVLSDIFNESIYKI